MGRETKILLGFLALLAGVFLGVLAVKLLVPRPPAGAGPDIRTEVAVARPIELVDPPSLDPPSTLRRRFAAPAAEAAPTPAVAPQTAAADAGEADFPIFEPTRLPAAAAAAAGRQHAPPATAVAVAPSDTAATTPARISRDPFVSRASYDPTMTDTAPPRSPLLASPRPDASAAPRSDATAVPAAVPAFPSGQPQSASAHAPETAAGHHCQPGDSWWSLAERAYGDGRLYRALFAWNRTIDPRVSLAPGTRLELPPRARLEAAWPKLLPGPAGQ